jgi:hypothetical protein
MKYSSNLTRSNASRALPKPDRDICMPLGDLRNKRFFMNLPHCPAGSKKVLKPESGIPIPFV